jgi:hypothetical protein
VGVEGVYADHGPVRVHGILPPKLLLPMPAMCRGLPFETVRKLCISYCGLVDWLEYV